MITLESLKLIEDILQSQDIQGLLGDCEDYMVDGFCQMCTALQELSHTIELLEEYHDTQTT